MVNYLTFTSVGTTSTVYLYNYSNTPNCQYSADGGTTWNTMPTSSGSKLSISAGQSILVKGTNSSGFSKGSWSYSIFNMTGSISASGSIMSLIDGVGETTTIPSVYCFHVMFYDCTSLTTPPELPATTLKDNCYCMMFRDCTALTTAPQLPATTLADSCYREMFKGCTNLKVRNTATSGYTHFFTCPSTISSKAVLSMFANTGGTYTSDPVANGTYYFEGSYPTTSSIIHANVNGTWKDTTPYVNVNGTWKEATPYVNVNGTWKESN